MFNIHVWSLNMGNYVYKIFSVQPIWSHLWECVLLRWNHKYICPAETEYAIHLIWIRIYLKLIFFFFLIIIKSEEGAAAFIHVSSN